MKARTRIVWLFVLLFVQSLYFLINQSVQGGVLLDTRWDAFIPLWPIWAVPYLLSLLWWAGSFVWAAWKMDTDLYSALVVGMLTIMLISYLIFIFYPTYVNRPIVTGDNWTTDLVRLIYSQDRSYNACPSGHAYTTVLIALFWTRWYPNKRWLWIAVTIIVLLSTLFTGQHYLLDLITGILLAWSGYYFGLWYVKMSKKWSSAK